MKYKKILIVKINKLGDTIAFLPTIEAIRKKYPDAHLTFLTTDIGWQIAKNFIFANNIWVVGQNEINTVFGFSKWLGTLRENKFDLALASSDSGSSVALLFFMSGIPERIGFTNPRLNPLFNIKIPFSHNMSHIELNLLLAKEIGCVTKPVTKPLLPVCEEESAFSLLEGGGIKKTDKIVVIHPGSDNMGAPQRWPIGKFIELTDNIIKKHPMKVVFIGSAGEKKIMAPVYKRLDRNSFVDLVGKTNFKELLHLISIAALFIGHPSGPLQIAYVLGTPSVSLWGKSPLVKWGPLWNKARHVCILAELDCLGCEDTGCPKGTFDCMNLITLKTVRAKVFAQLEKKTYSGK